MGNDRNRFSVYIASPLKNAPTARTVATLVANYGFAVSSTWHDVVKPGDVDPTDAVTRSETARQCMTELLDSWATLVLLGPDGAPRGTYVEAGMSASAGMPTLWVYAPRADHVVVATCFDALPGSSVHMSIQDAVKHLVDLRKLQGGMS